LNRSMRGFLRRITWRRLLAAGLDLAIVVVVYYVILAFRFAGSVPEGMGWGSYRLTVFLTAAVIIHLTANAAFGVYWIVQRYVGLPQAKQIVKATLVSVGLLLLLDLYWPTGGARLVPLSVVVVGGLAAGAVMTGVRFYSRVFQTRSLKPVEGAKRILVVGAGAAGEMLVRQVYNTPSLKTKIVGLVDDDARLHGSFIHDCPVLGAVSAAPRLAAEHDVEEFLIAIPSATSEQMQRIHDLLEPAGLPIKTLPALSDLIAGQVSVADARALKIEDLLGRSQVNTDLAAVAGYLKDRRVLVTGAAGSIGSELCRQIAAFGSTSLVLVDRDESGLYALHEDLRARGSESYTLVTADIRQRKKMSAVCEKYRPQVVFHAAAFKHVPLMEACPDEAVLNNVLGTAVVAQEAAAAGAERFVNISTDKAVDPISVMGASKRVAEMVVRRIALDCPDTCFCSVRFGNVLASKGSVVPIFERQIRQGGPVTVTHRDMMRYFMSISEAVQLVLQAASMADVVADGMGLLMLDMGRPIRILDLAQKMIAFMHDGNAGQVRIEFTGLRPGEKLQEVLVGRQECSVPTAHPLIHLVTRASAGPDAAEVPGAADVAAEDRRPADVAAAGNATGTGDAAAAGNATGTGDAADCGNATGTSALERAGLPADFDERVARLIDLARNHADREALIDALCVLIPTYRPFALEEPLSPAASAFLPAGVWRRANGKEPGREDVSVEEASRPPSAD